MYEEAQEIFEYLPIESGSDALYIQHLWGAFEAVIEREDPVRAFSILPFHLLFMFAIQYKVHRISAFDNKGFREVLKKCRLYRKDDRKVLNENAPVMDKNGLIPRESSVRNLSKIKESHLFYFFRIIGVDEEVTKQASVLMDIRSTYAHANGNIEEDLEKRIEEYLQILRSIQPKMMIFNDLVAEKWQSEIEPGESRADYVNLHLAEEYLCPADMQQGKLSNLDERLNKII